MHTVVRNTALACVFLGSFIPSLATAEILSGPLVNPGTGSTYYLLEQASWVHSQFEARELGGNLATVESAPEDQWIRDRFLNFGGNARALWTGLHDTREADTFEWISGSESPFRAWANGQPNDSLGGQQYVAITPGGFLRAEGWNDWADGQSDFFGTPFHGVVEVEPGDNPPIRDLAFAFTDFDEPAEGAADYIPGPGADELGFRTQILAEDGQDPTTGALPTSTTPTGPIFHHRSMTARTTFDRVRLLEWIEVSVTVDVQVRFTTYEDDDRVRLYLVNEDEEEIDLLNLQGGALDAFAGLGYRQVDAVIPESWREAQLIFESSTNSTQAAERIDIDNVAFRSPEPPLAPDVISFKAESMSIPSGAEAELRWEIFGAETVNIEPISVDDSLVPTQGSIRFVPDASATYTLVAENDAGVTTREIEIEVLPPLFGGRTGIPITAVDPISVHAADLTDDGAVEILVAAQGSGEVLLFENDEIGNFPEAAVISAMTDGASSVHTADLDGDGDADVISTSTGDRKLAWYENLGESSGQFGPQQIVDLGGVQSGAADADSADLDGDGDEDIVAVFADLGGGSNLLAWYENLGSGNFAGRREIDDTLRAWAVFASDLDGDSDIDLLASSTANDRVVWYPNDGAGGFGAARLVGVAAAPHADSILSADLDGDGDSDVLAASWSRDSLLWFANDGAGVFSTGRQIASSYDEPSEVRVADLDDDGDLDVLSAAIDGRRAAWHANLGGGVFSSAIVLFEEAERGGSVFPADVDADGDIDVLFTGQSPDTLGWVENLRIVNAPPQLVQPPADVTVDEDSGAHAVSLANVATDPEDGSAVLYEIIEIENESLFESIQVDQDQFELLFATATNQNGASAVRIRGSDRRGLSIETALQITVTPVNDRPTAEPIPDLTANDAADPDTVAAGDYFSDVDTPEGDRLTYEITGNSNPGIFAAIEIGETTGELTAEYADYVSGVTDVVIEATDSGGLKVDAPIRITLPDLAPPQAEVAGAFSLNPQTGLLEQRVTVSNNSARALGGFHLDIDGLADGAMLLNGSIAGNARKAARVFYGQPLAPGASVDFLLEYYVPSRGVPAGLELGTEVILPGELPNADGEPEFEIDRFLALPGGDLLIEFPSEPGTLYQVQYSSDGVTWRAAQGNIRAAGNRLQWIDQGLPRTHIHPRDDADGGRLYRVVELTGADEK